MTEADQRTLDEFLRPHGEVEDLRPMRSGEVIELALRVYRRVGFGLVKSSFPAAFITFLVLALTINVVVPGYFETSDSTSLQTQAKEVAFLSLASLILLVPIIAFATANVIYHSQIAAWNYLVPSTKIPHYKDAILSLFGLVFRVMMISTAPAMATLVILFISAFLSDSSLSWGSIASGGIGIVGLAVSGIWIFIMPLLNLGAPAVLFFEGGAIKDVLKRNKILSKTRIGFDAGLVPRSFLALVVIGLVFMSGTGYLMAFFHLTDLVKSVIGTSVFAQLITNLFDQVPLLLAIVILEPLLGVIVAINYINARIFADGLDIKLLHAELLPRTAR